MTYCTQLIVIGMLTLQWGIGSAWARNLNTSRLPVAEIATPTNQTLPVPISTLVQKIKLPNHEFSVWVQEVNAVTPLIAHEPDTPRNPASTMKLLTTWSALKLLGPAWRWKTEVWTRGSMVDGILQGDLILKGYGDPYLIYENFWQLLFDLRAKGLREIRGNLLVDNSYFALPTNRPVTPFDDSPERSYNALPSAVMFNFQATRFLFDPQPSKGSVDITPFPLSPILKIDNQVILKTGQCQQSQYNPLFKQQASDSILIQGSYSLECGQQFMMRLMSDPVSHVSYAFQQFWRALGGTISGAGVAGYVQSGDQLLHTYYSPALSEQVRAINKWSNNVMARQVLLTIGAHTLGAPATPETGAQALRVFLANSGIDTTGLVVENGSGLSRIERVTARQMGQMLLQIWHDPLMPEFISSLPLLGEDGTLVKRLRQNELRGRAHLKTGTLNDVSALAGYMLTESGKRLVVVIIYHGQRASSAGRALQDAILEWGFKQ